MEAALSPRLLPLANPMRLLLLKICALALALGVLAFVIHASQTRAQDATTAPQPSASASGAATRSTPSSNDDQYGIVGPATKADPHVMRRAAESLEDKARAAVAPSASASASAP